MKKHYLILFPSCLLLLGLGLGQTVRAGDVDDLDCISRGGACYSADQVAAQTDKDCTTDTSGCNAGVPTFPAGICCTPKTGATPCAPPNSCVSACGSENEIPGICTTDPTKPICCKPKCDPTMCKSDCTAGLELDPSKSTFDCPSGQNKCCKASGDTSTSCAAPNQCAATSDCTSSNRISGKTCSGTQVCCKAVCPNCMPAATGCTGGSSKDTAGTYQACATGQVCCNKMSGGTTSSSGAEGGSTAVSLSPGELSPVGEMDIPTLIGIIVKGALGIVGSIALLMFVYGGFLMLISQGDATKIQKGKTVMVWSVIGIMIIFGSYIFVSYIISGLTESGGSQSASCPQDYSCGAAETDKICQTAPAGACSSSQMCCKPK